MDNLLFNPASPTVLHIDLNSCFATIEQQANPFLRGKPVVVAAYTTARGFILAASIEAKKMGIKMGMQVQDGKAIYPALAVLPPDPWKYRNVHLKLRRLLSDYTYDFHPKSIDEFVLNLEGYPSMSRGLWTVSTEIKKRIKREIGDWLTVSIGLAPNRFLAKLASNLQKPDGLVEINSSNFLKYYSKLKLIDLPYIKKRNALRLLGVGISTVVDFYYAPLWKLKAAFKSINSFYWHLRLHGWEIDTVEFGRRSYGNSYALPKPFWQLTDLSPILAKLVTKMAARVRYAGFKARGVHVLVVYRDWKSWHKGMSFDTDLFDTADIYAKAIAILSLSPRLPVRNLAVSCFNLVRSTKNQLNLFQDVVKREKLFVSVDKINKRWGDFVITPARVLSAGDAVKDRIAFGGVKELEEFTLAAS